MTSRWMLVLYSSYAIVKISLFSMQYVWCMRATMLLAILRVCCGDCNHFASNVFPFSFSLFLVLALLLLLSLFQSSSIFFDVALLHEFAQQSCYEMNLSLVSLIQGQLRTFKRKVKKRERNREREKEKGAINSKRKEQISLMNSRDIIKFITNVIQRLFKDIILINIVNLFTWFRFFFNWH